MINGKRVGRVRGAVRNGRSIGSCRATRPRRTASVNIGQEKPEPITIIERIHHRQRHGLPASGIEDAQGPRAETAGGSRRSTMRHFCLMKNLLPPANFSRSGSFSNCHSCSCICLKHLHDTNFISWGSRVTVLAHQVQGMLFDLFVDSPNVIRQGCLRRQLHAAKEQHRHRQRLPLQPGDTSWRRPILKSGEKYERVGQTRYCEEQSHMATARLSG